MLTDCTIDVRHRVLVVLVFNSDSMHDWQMACPLEQKHDMADIMVRHIGHSRARRICREIDTISVVSGSSGKMEATDTTDDGTEITVSVVLVVDDSVSSAEVVAVTTRDFITITLCQPLLLKEIRGNVAVGFSSHVTFTTIYLNTTFVIYFNWRRGLHIFVH